MKIAVSGPHGTGKTTRAFELCEQYKKENPDKSVGLIQEIATKCPFPINEEQTKETFLWLFSKQILEELKYSRVYDIVVCDRTLLDCLAYSIYANKEDKNNYVDSLKRFTQMYLDTYDKIYFRTSEKNDYLIPDGIRTIDRKFQREVEEILKGLYKSNKRIKIIYE